MHLTNTEQRPVDSRVEAFTKFVDAVDRHDWRSGQLATKELRSMGLSVVLTPASPRREAPTSSYRG